MNEIHHEPANGNQCFVVYSIEGKSKKRIEIFRAGFSTEAAAKAWIAKHGDRPPQAH